MLDQVLWTDVVPFEPVPLPAFKTAMSEWPSGVTITTCWHRDGRPVGATLSSVTSLSLDPPMVLACFDRRSETLKALDAGRSEFLIHVLAHGQEPIAETFAGKADDKFAGIPWSRERLDLPEIGGCAMVLGCQVHDIHPGGDHMIVTGLVLSTWVDTERRPLVYHRRRLRALPDLPEITI
jgi:flavin reductase (DIM6/NTAB) family NADH-FMN oxidoreductase RutF